MPNYEREEESYLTMLRYKNDFMPEKFNSLSSSCKASAHNAALKNMYTSTGGLGKK